MILLLAAGILCILSSGLVSARVLFSSQREREAARSTLASYAGTAAGAKRKTSALKWLATSLIRLLSATWVRINPKASEERTTIRLQNAGLMTRVSPQMFHALQFGAAIVFAVLGFAAGGAFAKSIFLAGFFGGGTLYLSEFLLSRRATRRGEIIAAALPRVIDQLVISMEAGLSFDASLSHVVSRGEGPLIEEFRTMLAQMRVGESRVRALKRLAERVPGNDINALVQAVVQSEQQGLSLTGIMKAQASDLRHKRQLAAEEKAMKAPVKMLFPIVVFILPVMFVVIIGPAFVHSGNGILGG